MADEATLIFKLEGREPIPTGPVTRAPRNPSPDVQSPTSSSGKPRESKGSPLDPTAPHHADPLAMPGMPNDQVTPSTPGEGDVMDAVPVIDAIRRNGRNLTRDEYLEIMREVSNARTAGYSGRDFEQGMRGIVDKWSAGVADMNKPKVTPGPAFNFNAQKTAGQEAAERQDYQQRVQADYQQRVAALEAAKADAIAAAQRQYEEATSRATAAKQAWNAAPEFDEELHRENEVAEESRRRAAQALITAGNQQIDYGAALAESQHLASLPVAKRVDEMPVASLAPMELPPGSPSTKVTKDDGTDTASILRQILDELIRQTGMDKQAREAVPEAPVAPVGAGDSAPYAVGVFDEKEERKRINDDIAERKRRKLRDELRRKMDPEAAEKEDAKQADDDAKQNAIMMGIGANVVGGKPGQMMNVAAQFMNPSSMKAMGAMMGGGAGAAGAGAGAAGGMAAAAGPIAAVAMLVKQAIDDMGERNRKMFESTGNFERGVLEMNRDQMYGNIGEGVGGALGKIPGAAGMAVGGPVGAYVADALFGEAVKEATLNIFALSDSALRGAERLGEYDGMIASALAQREVGQIERDMARGQRFGDQYAGLVEGRSEMDAKIDKFIDRFLPPFLAMANAAQIIITKIVEFLDETIVVIIKTLKAILELLQLGLRFVPGVNDVVRDILQILNEMLANQGGDANSGLQQLAELRQGLGGAWGANAPPAAPGGNAPPPAFGMP